MKPINILNKLNEDYNSQWNSNDTPLNGLNGIPTKEISKKELDKRVFNELEKLLTVQDKKELVDCGGYYIKDYKEEEPKYNTTDVNSSSFSEFVDIPISLTVCWGDKEVPLNFTFREHYNKYSGGEN